MRSSRRRGRPGSGAGDAARRGGGVWHREEYDLIEYKGEIIVVDMGSLFAGADYPGVNYMVPDIQYLEDKIGKVKADLLYACAFGSYRGVSAFAAEVWGAGADLCDGVYDWDDSETDVGAAGGAGAELPGGGSAEARGDSGERASVGGVYSYAALNSGECGDCGADAEWGDLPVGGLAL